MAYLDALKLFPDEQVQLLSIGTGISRSSVNQQSSPTMGGIQWILGGDIFSLLTDSNQVVAHTQTKRLCQQNNHPYLRVNEYITIANFATDDTSASNYQKMIDEGNRWWDLYLESDFIKQLAFSK